MSDLNELYPSNSFASKKAESTELVEQRKVEKVISGNAVVRKPGIGKRIVRTFIAEDIKDIKTDLVRDVVVPAIKETLVDVISNGAERLFGTSRYTGKRIGNSIINGVTRTNYASISTKASQLNKRPSPVQDDRTDVSEVILESRQDAEDVLNQLSFLCEQYGVARVADYYELIGYTGDFQSTKWGWESVGGSRVRRVSGGYTIELPRPIYFD